MLLQRVNQRLSCSTSSTATQTATDLEAFFTIPTDTMHDSELADKVASEANVQLLRFSAIPDESLRTDAQQASVPVPASASTEPTVHVKTSGDTCVKTGVESWHRSSPYVKKRQLQGLNELCSTEAEPNQKSPSSENPRLKRKVQIRKEPPSKVEDTVIGGNFVKSAANSSGDFTDNGKSMDSSTSSNTESSVQTVVKTVAKVSNGDCNRGVADESKTEDSSVGDESRTEDER